jgi:ElaB/YqjD/DUF883 family membrane-anchored ribosome-binding protein
VEPSAKTDAPDNVSKFTREEFESQIGKLAERWLAHHRVDLALRHETGRSLNDLFGTPDQRQRRGEGTLKDAAERLRISQSEISRMRRFAFHYQSVKDWNDKYPDAVSWTDVKGLLPKEKLGSGANGARVRRNNRPNSKPVSRSLTALTSQLRKVLKCHQAPSEEQKQELQAKFQDLVKAVEDCLHVRLAFQQASAETIPSVSPVVAPATGTGVDSSSCVLLAA